MYESFYGLHEKPFSLLPDPGFFYLSKIHREALTLVEYGLHNQTGFTVLTGEIGSGKTTLMRYLLDKLDPSLTVGLISHTHQSLGQIMDWVCAAFELQVTPGDRIAQHRAFIDFLLDEYRKGKKTLLIIDEAQNLGLDRLEEIRLLSNVNADKDLVLQLLLLGQPQLRQQLREPDLEQFVQRISASYHLGRLTAEETFYYIRHRLKIAGGQKEIFSPDACHAVFHYSKGIPRIINLICETALVFSYGTGDKKISGKAIDEFIKSDSSHLLLAIDNEARTPLAEYSTAFVGTAHAHTEAPEDELVAIMGESREPPLMDSDRTEAVAGADTAYQTPGTFNEEVDFIRIRSTSELDDAPSIAHRLHSPSNDTGGAAGSTSATAHPEMPEADADEDVSIAELIKSTGAQRRWTSELLAIAAGILMGIGLVGWYIHHESTTPSLTDATRLTSEPTLLNAPDRATQPIPMTEPPAAHPDSALADGRPVSPSPASEAGASSREVTDAVRDSAQPDDATHDRSLASEERATPRSASSTVESQASAPGALPSLSTEASESPETNQTHAGDEDSRDSLAGQPIASQVTSALEGRLADLRLPLEKVDARHLRADFSRLIQFDDGSTELRPEAKALLERFATILRETEEVKAHVVAHTDSKGTLAKNKALSTRRAEVIARFLTSQGVPDSRVAYEGKGKTELKVSPEQEKVLGPWINRRVEIDLIEND